MINHMINKMRNAGLVRVAVFLVCIYFGINFQSVNAAEESSNVPEHQDQ